MKQLVTSDRRDIRLECVERPYEFRSPFGGQSFALMLVVNDVIVTPDEQKALSDQIVAQGCRYAVCAGHHCTTWDTSIDLAFIATSPNFDPPDDQFVMTTWHENDSIDEVVWFFLNCAWFEDYKPERFLICLLGEDSAIESEIVNAVALNG